MQFQRKKETFLGASFFKRRRELLERVARKSARVSRRKSLALLNFEERETSIEKFRVLDRKRETAIGYKKAKTNRNWVQILHFYHAKTVNIDMRLLWRSVASTKAF